LLRQPGCWLRSSHSFKECVIAHWSSDTAPIMLGTKRFTEGMGFERIGRGAFRRRRRYNVSCAGAYGRANVGISNDN
jgi:hypothetical protein